MVSGQPHATSALSLGNKPAGVLPVSTLQRKEKSHLHTVEIVNLWPCDFSVIIIVIIISFMQDIFTCIPETNCVPREYNVAAILLLLFMVLISLVSVRNLLYFYISTFRSMCAVPSMVVFFCSSLT